jgi:hypothetical protein
VPSKHRYRWLLNKLRYQYLELEESDPDLIMEYSRATGAKVLHQLNDYPKCPQLTRDLNKLASFKLVQQKRSYLYDLNGFMVLPRSTNVYKLTPLSLGLNTWVDR